MKKIIKVILGLTVAFITSCNDDDIVVKTYEETVVVANRGSNSISFIDANTNTITKTLSIPGSEPMYVVYVPTKDKLYLGDRAGKKIHIINPSSRTVENTITVGNGVFHMWADGLGKELWVSNDIDNTISVINLNTNTIAQTINVGMKPHDVFLTQDGTKAYVSVFNSNTTLPDKVYMYSTSNYSKTAEVNVGKDPHLFHLSSNNRLYVPCQSGQLYTLNGNDLTLISNNSFVGAHGIFPSPNQANIFITNISGNQLYSVNSNTSTINGTATASSAPTPHNIVVNNDGNKIFVSHSGTNANIISTYTLNGVNITEGKNITGGTNPFGITYYKRLITNN